MERLKRDKRRTPSSRAWLDRQINDPYVLRAKREGFRSRAAYKLAEIDDKFHLLKPGKRVVDLGAAPGGWSEVATRRVGASGHVLALDILDMNRLSASNSSSSIFSTIPAQSAESDAGRGARGGRRRSL